MSDRFDEFMRKNSPQLNGAMKKLELEPRRNWFAGVAISGVLAAAFAFMVVNKNTAVEYDDLEISLSDEFPDEYQDAESLLEEI